MTFLQRDALFVSYAQPLLLSAHLNKMYDVYHAKGQKHLRLLKLTLPFSCLLSAGEMALRATLRQSCNFTMISFSLVKNAGKVALCVASLFIVTPPLWCRPQWGEYLLKKMDLIGPQSPKGADVSRATSDILAQQVRRCSSLFETLTFPYILVIGAGEIAMKSGYFTLLNLSKTLQILAIDINVTARCLLAAFSLPPAAFYRTTSAFKHAGPGYLNLFDRRELVEL